MDNFQPHFYSQSILRRFASSISYRVPVLYFTQLMGLAFGLDPETLGIGKEFVDARPALNRIGIEAAVA
jgi:heterodisulfide reductase subunit B